MATASDAEINRALAAIEDPNSPEYHHYLTPEEYAQRFGPSAAALATVERSLSDAGFHVTLPSAGGSLLGAQGTVAQAEKFFGVQLSDYRTASGETYYAPDAGSAPAGRVEGRGAQRARPEQPPRAASRRYPAHDTGDTGERATAAATPARPGGA